jgi:transposase-like protein
MAKGKYIDFFYLGLRGKCQKLGRNFKRVKLAWVKKVQLFITDDLPDIENAIKMIYPDSEWKLCVLYTVKNSLNKVRAKDRGLFTENLKRIYRAEME